LSSFIANAHDEMYAFYTEKSGFLKKYETIGVAAEHSASPLSPPLARFSGQI